MSAAPLSPPELSEPLESPDVGLRVIRGGIVRIAGYGVGTALAALASVLVLRYLGVSDFGRFATVTSLVAIVGGLTDAGLSAIGGRDLAQRAPGAERRAMLSNLLGLRLVLTPLGVAGALVFAVAAGYETALLAGTALAGFALILTSFQATASLPLYVELKAVRITLLDVLQQAVLLLGVAVLVVAGAGLTAFFGVAVLVAFVACAATPPLVGRDFIWRPAFERREWRRLIHDVLPLAAASVINIVYFRMLILLLSFLTTDVATGLFATSFRITQMLLGVSSLALTLLVPVLAVAADDRPRLGYMLSRLLELAVITSTFLAVVVAFAAGPILDLLGGSEYRPATPVLQIQVFALIPLFVGQACGVVLVSLRRQSVFMLSGGAALLLVLAAGLLLIPPYEAKGAAVAAVIAETGLAAVLLVALARVDRVLWPPVAFLWKVLAGLGAAVATGFLSGLSPAAAGVAAGAAYVLVTLVTGALPRELLDAFRR